ncbi:GNAT family N-acetyltransferase [Sphingopyxis sp. Root1497]|uniref:GNAT family N-acetyltransferase n=1 Tax=Sphingopyxis sp. Root1497 TaxID=1736474 RepID=UPI003FA7C961
MLGVQYPDGLDWLERRLDDIESGRAQLWQAGLGKFTSGWAIVTPKGNHDVKLSTMYVAPGARGQGVGRRMIEAISAEWHYRNIFSARVTFDEDDRVTRGFFEAVGFKPIPDSRRQYGARFDRAYLLDLSSPDLLPVATNKRRVPCEFALHRFKRFI